MTLFQIANICFLFIIFPQYQTTLAVAVNDISNTKGNRDFAEYRISDGDIKLNTNDAKTAANINKNDKKESLNDKDISDHMLPPCKANNLLMITMGFLKLKKQGLNCRLVVSKEMVSGKNGRKMPFLGGVFSRRHRPGMAVWRGDLDSNKIEEKEDTIKDDKEKEEILEEQEGMRMWRGDNKKTDKTSEEGSVGEDSQMKYWRGDEVRGPHGINVWRGDAKYKQQADEIPTNGMALWRGDAKDRPPTQGMSLWRGDMSSKAKPPGRGMSLWRGDAKVADKPPTRGMSLWRGDANDMGKPPSRGMSLWRGDSDLSSKPPIQGMSLWRGDDADVIDKPQIQGMSLWRGDIHVLDKPPSRGMSLWRGDTNTMDRPPTNGMSLWRGDNGQGLPPGIQSWRGDASQPRNEMGVWRGDHQMQTKDREFADSTSAKSRPFRRYGDMNLKKRRYPTRRFGDTTQ